MRIAHVASEVVPFAKTGGLADVLGALPPALAALGHDVTVVTPAHRADPAAPVPGDPGGEVAALGYTATLRVVMHRGVRVVLLDVPALYVRPSPYSLAGQDYPDNPVRYAFLVHAALAAVARCGGAEIVHAHDWQAALAPLLLRHDEETRTALPRARSVLTIHNLAYQGSFPPWAVGAAGVAPELFTMQLLEFYGQVNFLKGGLASADAVTTVSPTYAREITTPQFGCGLEGALAARGDAVQGILNGLDLGAWNPARDPHLARPYGLADAAEGKRAARRALVRELGLGGGRPLLGVVSRLAHQKGADLLLAALDDIVAAGFDVAVLGSGERRYEEGLRAGEAAHPGRVAATLRFDEPLAHRIYAASDLFLMPSRYEPCGLGQMIAMRYGALPVVTATGGLADTVTDAASRQGTGFVLADLTPAALLDALARARDVLGSRSELAAMRAAAMAADFSWDASARAYAALYERLLAAGPRGTA